jgi:hypothetical protein
MSRYELIYVAVRILSREFFQVVCSHHRPHGLALILVRSSIFTAEHLLDTLCVLSCDSSLIHSKGYIPYLVLVGPSAFRPYFPRH